MNIAQITEWTFSLGILTGSLVVGLILEKLILPWFYQISQKTTWQGDDVIVDSLKGILFFWCLAGGIYGAMLTAPPVNFRLEPISEKSVMVIMILTLTMMLARISAGFIRLHAEKFSNALPATSIIVNIAKILILSSGLLMVIHALGLSITPLLTAFGVGGLAVALALRDTLSNLFAGLNILASKNINPGDYVKIDADLEGYVVDINWRSTTIKTIQDNIIVVPNAQLSAATLTNYHLDQQELTISVQISAALDSDLEKLEQITIEVGKEVMQEVKGGVPDYEPLIRFQQFGDFRINFIITLRVKEYIHQYRLRHEFIKRVHKRYQKEGIIIPTPIRQVYMK